MHFFTSLKKSFYNKEFYKEVPHQSFLKSLAFFSKSIALLSVLVSLILISVFSYFLFNGTVDRFMEESQKIYPDELVLFINKGEVSLNQNEPYEIPFSNPLPQGEQKNPLKNIAVIDTKNTPTIELFREYQTLMIVGKNSIAIYDDGLTFETVEIPSEIQITIDRFLVEELFEKVTHFLKKIGFLIFLVATPLLLFFFLFFGTLFYLLFATLFIWLVVKIKNLPYTYIQSYKIGMYLITLPEVLFLFNGKFGLYIPFLRTIALIALAVINLENKDFSFLPEKTNENEENLKNETGVQPEKA
ncbi:MAG: DUF1189 family protein [Candidatus Moraniibacteriota bacterium]|nr:MAG: DUF1189 family protein [Candidatus Moranbacteria bacterium]